MSIKSTIGEKIFTVINTIFLIALSLICLYPLWHVLMASFSNPAQVISSRGLFLWPKQFTTITYQFLTTHPLLLSSYGNTVIYVALGTTINLIMTFHASYVMSRRDLYFKKHIMFLIIVTMFISGGLIPNYLLIRSLNLYNTIWAILLPSAMNTFNMVMMRTYFQGLPYELEESAKIEGASDLMILYRIILPLSAPITAVVGLYVAVEFWNMWFEPMIYLTSRRSFPLQTVLREILVLGQTDSMNEGTDAAQYRAVEATLRYAVIVVATAPILCIYPFLQKFFTKGVLVGALKG